MRGAGDASWAAVWRALCGDAPKGSPNGLRHAVLAWRAGARKPERVEDIDPEEAAEARMLAALDRWVPPRLRNAVLWG
jgi:hypothetical protein